MTAKRREVSCQEAFDNLYEYLDGELTPDLTEAIRYHLSICAKCFPVFNFEKTYLRFLEARGKARGAPPELKKKILDQIFTNKSGE